MVQKWLGVCGIAVALAAATGCAKQYSVVTAGAQTDISHYVLVQYTKAGGMKLWDCREEPTPGNWDPTCVHVNMKSEPPKP